MATNSRSRFSARAAASLLAANLGLISLGSVLPALAGQNASHTITNEAKDAWRAAWQKRWIADQEAQQKAKEKSVRTFGASVHATTQAVPAQALPATPNVPSSLPNYLSQTKPDVFFDDTAQPESSKSGNGKIGAHTQDNAFAPVGDAWKLLAYLVPMLAVILVCLNLLKRFHTRTGRMPGLLQSTARYAGHDRRGFSPTPAKSGILSVLGGAVKKAFTSNARNQPASAIRLIESVPIGGANVHLLEVRGRVLLLGATAGSLNVLAEFDAQSGVGSDDFRDLLHTAAADMDALDYSQPDHPNTAAVTALEGLLRETGQAVSQRSRRLRTVREVEGEDV